jgi:hypothetical protein
VTRATVNHVAADGIDNEAPPPGTAIVRPLGHVRAVRQRYLFRFADPAEAAVSRSVRAWAWALGETAAAPITDRLTSVPPSRSEIEAEITVADESRLRGDRENRADAAATVLRWLIGGDDHLPVRGRDQGELVGGFGDVVRSPAHMAGVLAVAAEHRRRAGTQAVQDPGTDPHSRQSGLQDTDYLDGVIATMAWASGQRHEPPIGRARTAELTTRSLKVERLRAEDVIEQANQPWLADLLLPLRYGEGVKFAINWLLGDLATPPVDLA